MNMQTRPTYLLPSLCRETEEQLPLVIAEYSGSHACPPSAGGHIIVVSAEPFRHDSVLNFFLSWGMRIYVFSSLASARSAVDDSPLIFGLMFVDLDTCEDFVGAHETLVQLQADVPDLPVLLGSSSADTGQDCGSINSLGYTVVSLPIEDVTLEDSVAFAVFNSLRHPRAEVRMATAV